MERNKPKTGGKSIGSPLSVYPGSVQPVTGSHSSTCRSHNHVRPSSGTSSKSSLSSSRLDRDRTPEAAKNDKHHNAVTSDDFGMSDLRRVLQVAEDLQKIDIVSALNLYKALMKKTKNEEQIKSEEKYLKTRNEQMEQLTSGTITREREDLQDQFNTLLNEKERLQKVNEKLESKYKEIKSVLEQQKLTEMKSKDYEADIKRKDEELRQAKAETAAALKEKNEALTRLSKEYGTKMSDNNPNIADLSDPNRAMKLGEKYNEMYDNEWTDAMEILGEFEKDERKNVQKLLDVLKNCYKVCVDVSEKQMASLQITLCNPLASGRPKTAWGEASNPKTPKSIYKQLKDCRKEMSQFAADSIYKEHASDKFWSDVKTIPKFVQKCIELCWLMCVHDPPVAIGREATVGVTFDTNMYRPYTHSGTVVLYNVWPPLLLHENGPLLMKGVVQPEKVRRQNKMDDTDHKGMKSATVAKERVGHSNTYRVEPGVHRTGRAGYDPFEDAYGRYKSEKNTGSQQTNTWRDHYPETDRGETTSSARYTKVTTYDPDPYRSRSRFQVESRMTSAKNQDFQTSRPSPNYVQESVCPYSGHKLIQRNGVTYVNLRGEYFDYEIYKEVILKKESYA